MARKFHQVIDAIRESQDSLRGIGTRFEELVQVYLGHDREAQQRYGPVWRYGDWVREFRPDWSEQDRGIDLVAKIRPEHGGGWAAVQAKCRQSDAVLQRKDIDSFYSESKSLGFEHLIFVDTTATEPGKNFRDFVERGGVTRVRLQHLEKSQLDWDQYLRDGTLRHKARKRPRDHQAEAVVKVRSGLATADRGQIIMACGTGKTYTGLLVAEQVFGVGSRILVLVPSLALMSQMIREWHGDATVRLRSYSVCSDQQVGGRVDQDVIHLSASDLVIPPTTDPEPFATAARADDAEAITVVFATYHSLAVIHEAQRDYGLPVFDLMLCDEAHRTTGQVEADQEGSVFVRVHDADYVHSRKRLYLTATPRVYTAASKASADQGSVTLCSMDDARQFGEVLYYRGFAWAVENQLLSDYRVIVLALDEGMVNAALQKLLESEDKDIKLDDVTKIVGCYKALLKATTGSHGFAEDPDPCRRVLAFCNTIRNSKLVTREFQEVIEHYTEQDLTADTPWRCEVNHVDGTDGSHYRTRMLDWLADQPQASEIRILSNVRCLGEGVDVPALDGIVFFHPRKSPIDVVQAVGRVMRRAPGKKFGYVVLPVAIPSGLTPEASLKQNKAYETVWEVINALKSHDERLEADINRLQLEGSALSRIQILHEIPETQSARYQGARSAPSMGQSEEVVEEKELDFQPSLDRSMGDAFSTAVYAKLVQKVGRATYWQDWAGDVGRIAQTQITRIRTTLEGDPASLQVFQAFVSELQDDLNPAVTAAQALELLAQHVITRPIFNSLFEGHEFIQQNSVSKAMERVLATLDERNLEKETESLQSFYDEVEWRIQDTRTSRAKQELVRELYDKFFRTAFPRATEMLGIAFTPVELVDYVLNSTEYLLNRHFGKSLSDEGVHVIDPFVGTGTFITRLLQSGLIGRDDLQRKYREEIHANEMVLLAYYVAGINIEAVYHEARGDGAYEPFDRLVFQDTFQSFEAGSELKGLFPLNHERIEAQQQVSFDVVMGNPPYSKGQKSGSDNAANVDYPTLDSRISETYAEASINVTNKNMLYDSYVRAYRWATDRLGDQGVVAFVTGGGWLDGKAAAGIRSCFADEFSNVYVVNLRGNARLKGEARRKERDNVFEQASRSTITLTFLVKDVSVTERARIWYHDIGDYLSRQQKFDQLIQFQSLEHTPLIEIKPNQHHDWINQRSEQFQHYLPLSPRNAENGDALFDRETNGMKTHRDAWVYNFSKTQLEQKVESTIEFFNQELDRYVAEGRNIVPKDFVTYDRTKIAWSGELFQSLQAKQKMEFEPSCLAIANYRPMTKLWCYHNSELVSDPSQTHTIFVTPATRIRTICVSGSGAFEPTTWMVDRVADFQLIMNAKCFPRSKPRPTFAALLTSHGPEPEAQSGAMVSNLGTGVEELKSFYPNLSIHDDQVFYYIYGLLQCPEYLERFQTNLQKELPRIPAVASAEDFLAFAEWGRQLADLHVDYDEIEEYPVKEEWVDPVTLSLQEDEKKYRVEKMRFPDKNDRSTIRYNHFLTVSGIPEETYEFTVNGRSLVAWVMDRQQVRIHKDSGIVNDPNDFANETMKDPAYPLRLLKRAITAGIETRKIQQSMPPLKIHPKMEQKK